MAVFHTTAPAPIGSAFFRRIALWFQSRAEDGHRKAAIRETRIMLENLSDRDLEDIGIARGNISQVATKAVG